MVYLSQKIEISEDSQKIEDRNIRNKLMSEREKDGRMYSPESSLVSRDDGEPQGRRDC